MLQESPDTFRVEERRCKFGQVAKPLEPLANPVLLLGGKRDEALAVTRHLTMQSRQQRAQGLAGRQGFVMRCRLCFGVRWERSRDQFEQGRLELARPNRLARIDEFCRVFAPRHRGAACGFDARLHHIADMIAVTMAAQRAKGVHQRALARRADGWSELREFAQCGPCASDAHAQLMDVIGIAAACGQLGSVREHLCETAFEHRSKHLRSGAMLVVTRCDGMNRTAEFLPADQSNPAGRLRDGV